MEQIIVYNPELLLKGLQVSNPRHYYDRLDKKQLFKFACENPGALEIAKKIASGMLKDDKIAAYYYISWQVGNLQLIKFFESSCAFLTVSRWNIGLFLSCIGGHMGLAQSMIDKGANDWISGLYGASFGGYTDLVQLMIEKGGACKSSVCKDLWFRLACSGGNSSIVNLIIEDSLNDSLDWNVGLYGACESGNMYLVQLMIEKGACEWDGGLRSACFGGHMDIVRLMVDKGANPGGVIIDNELQADIRHYIYSS